MNRNISDKYKNVKWSDLQFKTTPFDNMLHS